jgi:hypothetical protein
MNTVLPMALLATLIAPGCDNTATNQPPSEAPPVADVRIEPAQPPAPSQIAQEDSKWEETQKKSAQAWDATREAGSSAWDATKETSAEAWDTTKEKSSETWQATKETSSDLWDKTKSTSGEAWDATKEKSSEAWEATKSGSKSIADKVDEKLSGDSTAQ